ncbi:MAG: autotransporter domain-containing protein, partial [Chlamydiales bacterium]|nr:autotransporter domain-containing protein [Chlamydiales bacterium]
QILVDGGGGLNSDGAGSGQLTATISTQIPLRAINEIDGTISNQTGSSANKIGQIIFDGSKGGPSSTGSGILAVAFENTASLNASNSGSISNTGTALGLGQILFDGTGGSCTVQLSSANTIFALNTATGTIEGNQIAFYNTVIQGNGTVQAVNEGGTILHGVAFYGPLSAAENLNVELSRSSLWVDATTNSSFAIGSLSGDTSSSATLNQSFTINTSSGTQKTFAGNISGSGGLTITGNGQQILAGTNSYTGSTNILSGMLTLQNSNIAGTLFVANGATFSGTGTVANTTTIEGTIKPGNSPGTLTFLNGLILSPSSTTQIEVNTTQSSLLAVSGGNASIAGTLQILEDPGVRAGNTYPIITVNGANLLGTFYNITTTGPLIPVIVYSGNEATLTLENSPATFAALLNAPDRILRNLETLKHLDVRRKNIFKTQMTSSELTAENSEIALFGRKPTQTKIQESQQLAKKAGENSPKPWSVYIEPMGSFGHVTSKNNVFGNTFQMVGARAGTDYLWTDECPSDTSWRYGLGFLTEYSHLWGQLDHNAGTFTNNLAYGSIYSTFVPAAVQELSLNIIGGGGYSWYTFHRYPLGSSSLQAKGTPGGVQADGLFDIEYVFRQTQFTSLPKHFSITPSAAVQYTYAHINGYQESGAGIYNLKIDHQTTMTLSSLLGLRMSYLFLADSSITVCPELLAEWQHQFLNDSIDTASALETASFGEFSLIIPQFPRNSLVAGADIRIDIYKKAMVQLNYDLWYNQRGIINFFLLECKTEF